MQVQGGVLEHMCFKIRIFISAEGTWHDEKTSKIVKRGITEKNIQWTVCICVFAISLVELHSHLIISLQKLMSQDSQRQPYRSKSVKKKLSLSHFICLFR